MKIAFLLNRFPEISEKFIVNQLTGLIDASAEVDVYAAFPPDSPISHETADKYGFKDITRYSGLPVGNRSRLLKYPFLFAAVAVRHPTCAVRALRIDRYRTTAKNGKLPAFFSAFGERRYDVLHCHFGPNGLIGAYLKDCGIARRLVVSFHGSDINSYPKKHGEHVYGYLYAVADIVTANTRFTADKLIANGCPAGKIRILPVGLRMDEFPETAPVEGNGNTVATVARLVEKKGIRYAIEAIAELKRARPDIRYSIAGDGPLREELSRYARSLGVGENVEFLGALNDREVRALLLRSSVFVLPSVTASDGDMEGQGLVLQEAQACGVPVVSTLHNGIPDGVLDGESGLLVPEKDSAALASALGRLLDDAEMRRSMGVRGRAFVGERYDIPVLSRRLLDIYREVSRS